MRLSALEQPSRSLRIDTLAIPDITSTPSTQLDQEVKRLRPKIEEILREAKRDNGVYTPGVLWASQLLLGDVTVMAEDREKILETPIMEGDWNFYNSIQFWYLAYAIQLGITPSDKVLNKTKSDMLTYIDENFDHINGEYNGQAIHTLAAGRSLFPEDPEFGELVLPDLKSYIVKTIARNLEVDLLDHALDWARDFKVFFPHERNPFKTYPEEPTLDQLEDKMELGSTSQFQAVTYFGILKWIEQPAVLAEDESSLSAPPVRRQF